LLSRLLGAIESIYELCDSLACVSVLSVGEALPSSRISALYLAAAFAGNESGLFHPVSLSSASSRDDLEAVVGNCAITKALASTVLTHGGDVCFAAVKGFVGEDNSVKGVELSEGDVLRGDRA
jgi:phytoene dehydrogenase-like protein